MARTLSEIQADLDKYQAALDKLLLGETVEEMSKGDRKLRFRGAGADQEGAIRRRLAELRAEYARAGGGRSPRRPVVV